jgi:hypothetical protein
MGRKMAIHRLCRSRPVLPACDMSSAHPAAIRRILQCKRVVGLLQNVADRLQLSRHAF